MIILATLPEIYYTYSADIELQTNVTDSLSKNLHELDHDVPEMTQVSDMKKTTIRLSNRDRPRKLQRRHQPKYLRKYANNSNVNYSTINGLINIGCTHSSTTSIQQVLCTLQDFICGLKNEFSYFPKHKKDIYHQLFLHNPSDQLLFESDLETLSEWNMDIDQILKAYTYQEWISNWDLHDAEDMSNYVLYGKFTSHHVHPPTAMIFSHMAYHRKYKFTLHIREPISRLWSVQQHWHRYQGSGDEIRRAAANDIYDTYAKLTILQNLVNAIEDDTKSNDYIIGLYYKLYFTTLRERKPNRHYKDSNPATFEVTTNLYCVHVMLWLKQFEKYFDLKDISQYFKLVQFEHMIQDLSLAKKMIYCWYKENVNNIKDCKIEMKERDGRKVDNYVHRAGDHRWSVDMRWIDRKEMMELFIPCNARLNKIIHGSTDLVLGIGEWINYNQMYDIEKQQNHNDTVVERRDNLKRLVRVRHNYNL